jgi:acyl carrier protein
MGQGASATREALTDPGTPDAAVRPAVDAEESAERLLEIARDLALELHPHRARARRATLDASLERDLGLDSLGRVELWGRVERAFGVRLPESLLGAARTPRDLLAGLLAGGAAAAAPEAARVGHAALGVAEAVPESVATLLEALAWHVHAHPDRAHLILCPSAQTEQTISYRTLYDGSRRVAAGLHARGHGPGESVAIMLPTSRGFFEAFLGVLLAGGVPVPIYPPARPAQIEEHLRRQAAILSNARATALLTQPEARRAARLLRSMVEGLRTVETVDALAASGPAPAFQPVVGPGDIALLQYTSGSTGQPKGVVLSHGNLLANIRAMGQALEVSAADVFVSWLPLYHDMGLIGAWLGCLYHAIPAVILSPLQFLARPENWFRAIHRHRGTLSASPNFGYGSASAGSPTRIWRGSTSAPGALQPMRQSRSVPRPSGASASASPAAASARRRWRRSTDSQSAASASPSRPWGARRGSTGSSATHWPGVGRQFRPGPGPGTRSSWLPAAGPSPGTRSVSWTPRAARCPSGSRGACSSGDPRRPAATSATSRRRASSSRATGSNPATWRTSPAATCT